MSATASVLVATGLAAEARLLLGASGLTCVFAPPRTLDGKLEEAADRSNFSAVVSFGLCGGLSLGLRAGSLVVASGIVSPAAGALAAYPIPARQAASALPSPSTSSGGRMEPAAEAWWLCAPSLVARLTTALTESQPSLMTGLIAGSDVPLLSAREKRDLHLTTNALAVDTESHVAAAFAARHRLPFAALRAVCDTADRDLPPLALRAIDTEGKLDWRAIRHEIIRQPSQILILPGTALATAKAMRTLRRVGRLLGPGLGLAHF